jgi:hypothetical protein
LNYLIILLFTGSFISNVQTINGFIYDYEATIKSAKLINTTQNIATYSDDKGQFKIGAKLKDTHVISSYFYATRSTFVTSYYFEKAVDIEVQKITNALDVVKINKI